MRRGLYIGRFQPFHLGHVDVIQHIAAAPDIDAILLALGSPEYDHRRRCPVAPWSVNPFTCDERREMIERSLAGRVDKPFSIHPVTDRHPDHDGWCDSLLEGLPAFEVLYTADAGERRMLSARGKEVRGFPRRFTFHGGVVRSWLAAGEPWRHAVTPEAADVLERIDAPARLRDLLGRV